MKKIMILLLSMALFSTVINAQTEFPEELLEDAELKSNFVGKWVANHEGITYEMTLTPIFINFEIPTTDQQVRFELIVGYMIYKRGNEVIRTTNLDGFYSFLAGETRGSKIFSSNRLQMRLNDKERDVNGDVEFVLSDDKESAAWTLDYVALRWGMNSEDRENDQHNRTRTFDIPKNLVFYKVVEPKPADPVIPTDPTVPTDPPKGPIKKPAGPGDTNPGNPIVVTSTTPESK